jgi:hypothetical protein
MEYLAEPLNPNTILRISEGVLLAIR